jgi:hypothetical protein
MIAAIGPCALGSVALNPGAAGTGTRPSAPGGVATIEPSRWLTASGSTPDWASCRAAASPGDPGAGASPVAKAVSRLR